MDKSQFNKHFGEYVKKSRLEQNITQQQLSDKMGLDYQYISRVERGLISPTLFWISGLSKALDIDLGVFITKFNEFK
jgi:transcriptional regulator with XRE-family HTH domain